MPNEIQPSGTPTASGTNYGGDNPNISSPGQLPSTEVTTPTVTTSPSEVAPEGTETMEQALEAFNKGVSGTGITTTPLAEPGINAAGRSAAVDTTIVKPTTTGLDYRVYDGLNEEDKVLFKHMSRDAYNKLYPLYLKHKEVVEAQEQLAKENAEIKDRHFYEQENAYQLVPEYQSLVSNATLMDQEIAHWSQQLRNVKRGMSWKPLVPNEKGEPCIGPEIPITGANDEETEAIKAEAEAYVMAKLAEGQGYRNQYHSMIGAFHERFKNEHSRYVSSFDTIEAKVFNGADKTKLDAAAATKLALFPKHMQGRREIKSYAKALVLIDGLLKIINTRQGTASTQAIVHRTAASGGPVSGELHPVAGAGANGTVGAIQDEMEKLASNGWKT